MLILSRRHKQRARITTPCGDTIWLTMRKGYIECDDGKDEPLQASAGNSVYFDYDAGTVEIIWYPRRKTKHNDSMGIIAPMSFSVLREELIDAADT